jgi:hypothetical protein
MRHRTAARHARMALATTGLVGVALAAPALGTSLAAPVAAAALASPAAGPAAGVTGKALGATRNPAAAAAIATARVAARASVSGTAQAAAIMAAGGGVAGAGNVGAGGVGAGAAGAGASRVVVGRQAEVSRSCSGQNAEVETAIDPATRVLYEEWIGCGGIGFARSADGGRTFSRGFELPASGAGWDPAVAVGPTGTVYAAFMVSRGSQSYPVVDISADHGTSFRVSRLVPPHKNNWGDRDFIAISPAGTIYVTWDYGPSASEIKFVCSPSGSCSFSAGDLNAVLQKSTDNGKTWSKIIPISPGFPASGADSAPILVQPDGQIDVEYQGYRVLNRTTLKLGVAHSYFTASSDNGRTWSRPHRLGPAALSMNTTEWWIDGDIGTDAAGGLYATWDTQSGGHDIGWLSFSTTHGRTWSGLVRVTPDNDQAVHIVQVIGGARGRAYVGWLTDSAKCGSGPCYAQYLRVFSATRGWLSGTIRVASKYGNWHVWPGDTIGLSLYPGGSPGSELLAVSWGSALGGRKSDSQIWASVVRRLP